MSFQIMELPNKAGRSGSCPECGSNKLIQDKRNGEKVCSECGYVTQQVLFDRSREWRAFNTAEINKRSRVGMPRSLAVGDMGLHTLISKDPRSVKGKISREKKCQIIRISRWQSRINDSSTRKNLNQAMGILSTLCSHMHIPRNVREQTALYYRKALKADLVRGRSIETVLAACLYAACRLMKTQRSLKDISEYTSHETKDLAKCYRKIVRSLNLDVPRQKAQHMIPKIAEKIRVKQGVQRAAVKILREAEDQKLISGKSPSGLAAAALYISCKQNEVKRAQKDIAFAAGVTEVTIRNRYKDLAQQLDIEI